MKEIWDSFLTFLTEYDLSKIMGLLAKLKLDDLLYNPLVWLVVILSMVFIIWKRLVRLGVLAVTLVLFVLLLQSILPQPGEQMSLEKLLKFVGGTGLLVGVNLYFLLVREK